MSDLQDIFNRLHPCLLGVRSIEGLPVIDVQMKEGWLLPDLPHIHKTKGEGNVYVIFSQQQGIGLDHLIDYLENSIKANVEREKKVELLKQKMHELKDIFTTESYSRLQKLKFTFTESDPLSDVVIDMTLLPQPMPEAAPQPPPELAPQAPISEEERELREEEKRAENYRRFKELNGAKVKKSAKVELPPPKQKIANAIADKTCKHGPDEFCDLCMENRDL